jgi:hypothetical protein
MKFRVTECLQPYKSFNPCYKILKLPTLLLAVGVPTSVILIHDVPFHFVTNTSKTYEVLDRELLGCKA